MKIWLYGFDKRISKNKKIDLKCCEKDKTNIHEKSRKNLNVLYLHNELKIEEFKNG